MYRLLRKALFLMPPEKAHYFAMGMLKALSALPGGRALLRVLFGRKTPSLETTVFGIRFPHPVGLAAGFDKDARWLDALECLGFAFVEIGTVTPLPQPGNERPRLFRLPADRALINRMGFNNGGADRAAARIRARKGRVIVGGNIGKNKVTPNDAAGADYEKCFESLYDVVDYFVVNVSSPNTPGLRALQEKEPLRRLLTRLAALNRAKPAPRPILLKIAPDLDTEALDDIVEIALETGLAGLVATNTTISREGLSTPAEAVECLGAGGLSGKPLELRSTEVIRYLSRKTAGKLPLIAAGGIFTAEDAREKLRAGASLVQVYTGFIYEGPGIAGKITRALARQSR